MNNMQMKRFEIFKSQDHEKGHFDVALTFEAEGMIIHSHKFYLSTVSKFFEAKFSGSSKVRTVKIENCSYENFYAFLCFFYSGECTLTDENIIQIIDITKVYDVPYFQSYCDDYLASKKFTLENVEEMFEFAHKYSLHQFHDATRDFILRYGRKVFQAKSFVYSSKAFVEFVTFKINEFNENNYLQEELFEAVYKWAEHQTMKQQRNKDDPLNIKESVKTELTSVISFFDFRKMNIYFLRGFVVANGIITEEQANHYQVTQR